MAAEQRVFVAFAMFASNSPSLAGVFDSSTAAMDQLNRITTTQLDFEHYRNQWYARSTDGRDLFLVSEESVRSV